MIQKIWVLLMVVAVTYICWNWSDAMVWKGDRFYEWENHDQAVMNEVPQMKWFIYKDVRKKWRWRVTASNGEIVGASTQGYKYRADVIDNAELFGYKP